MSNTNLLILPHQLFDPKYIPKDIKNIYIYEHPQYFKKYNFNKKKLVLHRASMKKYEDLVKRKKFNVFYINFNETLKIPSNYCIFDPIDKIKFNPKPKEVIESPNFLLTKEDYGKYRKKTDKFMFQAFYMFGKKINDIIPTVKSQDKQNRQKLPKSITVPKLPSNKSTSDSKYIKDAQDYVSKHFSKNYGKVEDFQFPISHQTASKWLDNFIKKKFTNFGPYEDFIVPKEDYLFHSVLSCAINIGLLNPLEIIDKLRPLKDKVPLNSYEGYIRQLYWREYQRYTYIYCDFSSNYFGFTKKLGKEWYDGTTGIDPVDNAIKTGFENAYLHHINRLMVIGNYMNLCNIAPKEGFRWFMEFSIDSYEWVMYQNVLDMVFFVTGGKTMRKPYISKSNYIVQMSRYTKKEEWTKKWDDKYDNFLKQNKDKLWKFRYAFPTLKKIM